MKKKKLPKYGTGSTVGSAAGFAAGQSLNLWVPGLGTLAAPLTAAGGAWVGDKIEDKWFSQEEGDQEAELRARNRMMGLDQVGLMSGAVQTNTNPLYAYGGHTGPNAEIEDKELVQLPKGRPLLYNGGRLNQQSMDTYAADGLTHEQGGMETGLPEGTRVFSDRIKHNGRTIASLAKPIANKIGQLEKKHDNPVNRFTIDRLRKQQDSLFETQETIKQDQDMKRSLKKFANGGPVNSIEEFNAKYGTNYKSLGDFTNFARLSPMEKDSVYLKTLLDSEKLGLTMRDLGEDTKQPKARIGNLENRLQEPFQSTTLGSRLRYAKGGLIKYQYGGPLDEEEYYTGVDPNYNPNPGPYALNPNTDTPMEFSGQGTNFGSPVIKRNEANVAPITPTVGISGATPSLKAPSLSSVAAPVGYSKSPVTNDVAGTGLSAYAPLAAAGVSAVGSLLQSRNINKTPAPARINAINAPMIDPFTKVDLSQERVDLNRDVRSGRADILRNSGSFSTQAANLGKLRASQLMGRGNINMREQNANTQIENAYKQASAEVRARNAANQQAVDQQNMENQYNYNLWKSGQKNAVISDLTGTGVNLLNNKTQHENQLAYYDALAKGYAPGLLDRNTLNPRKKAKGGIIKSSKK